MGIIPYLHLAYNLAFFLAGWVFGDWRNWRAYYPTIVFFIAGDTIHYFLTKNLPLWKYHGTIPSTHILISLLIMFVAYPATVLIYLKYCRRGRKQFISQYIFWVFSYSFIEFINLHLGLISHYHGWNIWWSLLTNSILFLNLRVHFSQPLLAWIIYAAITTFMVMHFNIPLKG